MLPDVDNMTGIILEEDCGSQILFICVTQKCTVIFKKSIDVKV